MKGPFLILVLVGGLLLAPLPSMAHHSFAAEFDATKPKTLKGHVLKIDWTNPHVWVWINVKDEKGVVDKWGFEMGPPHLLQGQGWMRTTLKIGDEVVVEGSLAKNGSKKVNARSVLKDGKRLDARSSQGVTP